ncbi:hypothetical protein [Chromobacterium violaceum]|uniref:hypothetical protein n=1 Tax=Chromobacterium violaceum TaxID=536 RepID=UPI001B31BCC5|nr:hypothetical protein [Chromobacterium violaceum]MBP4047219.1 hypothetical protein [Chromobacterium violaceum]
MNFDSVNITFGDFNYVGYPVISLPKEAAELAICSLLKELVFSLRNKSLQDHLGGLDYIYLESAAKSFQSNQLQGDVPLAVQMWADLKERSVIDSVSDILNVCTMLREIFSAAAAIQIKGVERVRSAGTVEGMVLAAREVESQLKDIRW